MNKPIKSNQSLNKEPKVGNLIDPQYFGPILAFFIIACLGGLWGVSLKYCIGFFLWGSSGWLLWAGKKPYIQIAKLMKRKPNWITARVKYRSRENIKLR